ncbi:trimethyllysine dioxygenase, mitochondrial-like [Artemia franciscana]|uniref:Trimethyllysine dioxygenase, mitochondrial n=1 Tax=Artemia franciscana TaxID=6661 RepID=A0AA88ICJ3_ARTSF|nr:hypothetical protein QYM36_000508 [Artemia franciscana]
MKQVLKQNPVSGVFKCLVRSVTNVFLHEGRLQLHSEKLGKPLCFYNVWLRDHCRCNECYHVRTNQRLFDILKLDQDSVSKINKACVKEDLLTVSWADGHKSTYSINWLLQHTHQLKSRNSLELWDSSNLKIDYYPYEKFMSCDKVLRDFLVAMVSKGVAIVSDVPPSVIKTRETVERLSPVMKTFYGEMWEFSDNLEYSDTAYTSDAIESHTDTTYMLQSVGIQVLHCLKHNGEGGENTLVDGFNCVKQFKNESYQGYNMLSSLSTPGEYIDGERHYKCDLPMLLHNQENELIRVRYNTHDRAPLETVPPTLIPEYYRHLIHLTKIIRNPKNVYLLKLTPGNVIFMDNWRILHGRLAYTGARVMTGCYIDRSDFESSARFFNVLP